MNKHIHTVRELPPGLELLADLAIDLRWTWSHAGDALWEALDPKAWEQTENPYVILQNLPQKRLEELAGDLHFKEQLEHLAAERDDYYRQSSWYSTACPAGGCRESPISAWSLAWENRCHSMPEDSESSPGTTSRLPATWEYR